MAEHLKEIRDELTGWRHRCFSYADLFNANIYTSDSPMEPGIAAGIMARHVLTQFGIELASRVEELDRLIAKDGESSD